MTTKQTIDAVLGSRSIAVVGVSRQGNKFGNLVYRELKQKGYSAYQVNPHADEIDGDPCFRSPADLPPEVEAAVISVPPDHAEGAVRETAAAGITKIWLQQGAESPGALAACEELNVEVVSGNCILMFAEPVTSIHKLHRVLRRVFGRMPA